MQTRAHLIADNRPFYNYEKLIGYKKPFPSTTFSKRLRKSTVLLDTARIIFSEISTRLRPLFFVCIQAYCPVEVGYLLFYLFTVACQEKCQTIHRYLHKIVGN